MDATFSKEVTIVRRLCWNCEGKKGIEFSYGTRFGRRSTYDMKSAAGKKSHFGSFTVYPQQIQRLLESNPESHKQLANKIKA
ncbi:unnamed protein product [Dovyalis caffra]|uniref:Uncharacterized protein n=1 Tax=Dovyalis caffra TaxID=77055 RepID=A0AAV1RSY5_9ROSI|nr:unnamed protein product [Dovyalis caffra]